MNNKVLFFFFLLIQKKLKFKAHQEELLLFPFVVLARLFNTFDPADVGIERAQAIRDKALKMGIVDVLLTSLAHFSKQPNRLEPLHPAIAEEQPMVFLNVF